MKEISYIWSKLNSIRVRLVAVLLALTVISAGTFAYLGLDTIQKSGKNAAETSSATLREQAQTYLLQIIQANAEKNDLILQRIQRDAAILAQYAASILSNPASFAGGDYWSAEENLMTGAEGQRFNGTSEVTSVFVPNLVDVDEQLLTQLEATSYLDFLFPSTFSADSNSVAVFLGTEREIVRYFPNVNLGAVLPPDFQVTQRPWYLSAAHGQNPAQQTVWSEVYEDATGLGLLVTAAAPVYAINGEFMGVIGIDVTLANLRDSIENTTFATDGYFFLVDRDGRAIALPDQGYQDFLGRPAEPEEVGTWLTVASEEILTHILDPMRQGETGFTSLNLGGRELFITFAPLSSTGWGIGGVIEAEKVLAAVNDVRTEIANSTDVLLLKRALPWGTVILVLVTLIGLGISGRLARPIQRLAASAQEIGHGRLDTAVPGGGGAELEMLAQALRDMSKQLQELIGGLEHRVSERTQALARRATQLETAARVAQAAAAVTDPQALLHQVVNLISEHFEFYHAGIFLLDDAGEYAVLRAASSPGGQRMLERHHRLRRGQEGIVGYVTETGTPRIALDVGQDAVFFNNPDLPETRSEMALPLRVRGRIIGALDVQSTAEAAFTPEDIEVLQTLADQVALALSSAQYRQESEQRMAELQRAYGVYSRETLAEAIRAGQQLGFRYSAGDTVADQTIWYPEMDQAMQTGEIVQAVITRDENSTHADGSQRQAVLAVPIKIHGETIGVVNFRKPAGVVQWFADELDLIQTIIEQMGLTLETAQLYQDTQRRAAQEQMIGEIAARMRETLDIETVLKTATQEVRENLGLPQVTIWLASPNATSTNGDGHRPARPSNARAEV